MRLNTILKSISEYSGIKLYTSGIGGDDVLFQVRSADGGVELRTITYMIKVIDGKLYALATEFRGDSSYIRPEQFVRLVTILTNRWREFKGAKEVDMDGEALGRANDVIDLDHMD